MLLTAGAALVALRTDLARWQVAQGDRLYRSGDHRGAIEAWSSSLITPSIREEALIGRGAARYRLGELAKALVDFKAAAASPDAALRQEALYNLGTTSLIMTQAEKSIQQDNREKLLSEAVRHLQAATELNPSDAAAIHNREVARARLSALQKRETGAAAKRQVPEKTTEVTESLKKPGEAGTNKGKPGTATELDNSAGRRRAIPAMSTDQALRMLDDARGREALRSDVAAGNSQEKLSPPEKDW
jgi:tetratricopeptide (TPR) repeat protein